MRSSRSLWRALNAHPAMRNNYQIIDYSELGLPTMVVLGECFHYQDLYELVGKDQFMTTFELTEGSVVVN